MTVEERFERMEKNLNMLIKIHLDNDREYRERFDHLMTAIEELRAASKQDGEHIMRSFESLKFTNAGSAT